MTPASIRKTVAEAERFIRSAKLALQNTRKSEWNGHTTEYLNSVVHNGATRRASMDLTRALAEMRRAQ